MTPERAAEMASRIRADYAISMDAKEAIQQAILQACAEEREACAKIALASQSSAGYDICQIIRGAK